MHSHPRKRKLLSIGMGARGIIAIGVGAHGIIAIGVSAHGIIAIGISSMGIVSIGAVSMGLASVGAVSMGLATVAPVGMGLFFKFPKQEMPSMEMHSKVEQDRQHFIDQVQPKEKVGPMLAEFPFLQRQGHIFPKPSSSLSHPSSFASYAQSSDSTVYSLSAYLLCCQSDAPASTHSPRSHGASSTQWN